MSKEISRAEPKYINTPPALPTNVLAPALIGTFPLQHGKHGNIMSPWCIPPTIEAFK